MMSKRTKRTFFISPPRGVGVSSDHWIILIKIHHMSEDCGKRVHDVKWDVHHF